MSPLIILVNKIQKLNFGIKKTIGINLSLLCFNHVAPGQAPSNIRVVKTGYVSVSLSWDAVDSRYVIEDIESYDVRYSSEKEKNFKFLTSIKNNITIKNLTDDTRYYFAVAARTTHLGVFSSDLTVKTKKSKRSFFFFIIHYYIKYQTLLIQYVIYDFIIKVNLFFHYSTNFTYES